MNLNQESIDNPINLYQKKKKNQSKIKKQKMQQEKIQEKIQPQKTRSWVWFEAWTENWHILFINGGQLIKEYDVKRSEKDKKKTGQKLCIFSIKKNESHL